jgi:hypothetical protein
VNLPVPEDLMPDHANHNPAATTRRDLAALFAVSILVRLALLALGPWFDPGRAIFPDSSRYLELAENLGRFKTFGLHEEEPSLPWRRIAMLRDLSHTRPAPDRNGLRPESFRTPGYPLFIAAVRSLITPDVRAILLAQCLLGSLSAVMVAWIASTFGIARRGCFAAGLIWAIHPGIVVHDCALLSECLSSFCLASSLLLNTRGQTARDALLSGALLGLAGLVRPLVGFLFLPANLLLACRGASSVSARAKSLSAACLVAGALLPSGAWALRNYYSGEGLRVSPIASLNLLYYAAGYAIAEERREDWVATWPDRVGELADRLGGRIGPGEDVYSAAGALAVDELRGRPTALIRVLVKSQVKLLVAHSLGDAYHLLGRSYHPSGLFSRLILAEHRREAEGDPATVVLALAWTLLNIAIAAGAVAGALVAARRGSFLLLSTCGVTILLVAIVTSTNGLERFRIPMMLPLAILVAEAISPAAPRSRSPLPGVGAHPAG